jgi:hypothetical protein
MMCNRLRWAISASALISISVFAQAACAVPTVFFDRDVSTTFMMSYPNSLAKFNQFTSTLSSFGVDGADSAAGFDPQLIFGATGITAKANGTLAQAAPGFMIGAQALLEADAAGLPQVNTNFVFNQYIKAFGLYVIQGGDGANNNPITFRLKNTAANTFTDVPVQVGPGWEADNAFFVGITDTNPFNAVELIEAGDVNDGMLYDNIVAGNAIPEPASLMLVIFGGACACCSRGRRG